MPTAHTLRNERGPNLQNRFVSQQARSELIADAADSERRLLNAMLALGYPQARLVDRSFNPEASVPELTLEPGPRRYLDKTTLWFRLTEESTD